MRLLILVGCGQLYLPSNEIVVFVDRPYPSKELIDILFFVYGVSHQGKGPSETTTLGFMWPGVSLV